MKRPILVATISYINGIIIGVYLSISIPLIIVLSLVAVLISCVLKTKYKNVICLYLVMMCIVSVYVNYKNVDYENKYIELNGSDVRVVGTIVSDIEEKENIYTFTLRAELVNGKKQGDLLKVNVKKKNVNLEDIKYGNKILILGTYEEPSKARNYKGFDYKNYLKTQKIYGIVSASEMEVLKENNVNLIDRFINSVKMKIRNNLKELLPEEAYSLAIGILIGDDSEIDEEVVKSFKDSNLAHMLAISGAHTNYVILVIALIANKKHVGIQRQRAITIVVLLVFMKLTGMSPSVVRAGTTCIIYLISKLIYRKADVANTMAIAVLFTLISNPFNLFNIGMQLSYAGSISIILFYSVFSKKVEINNKVLKYIVESMLISISANILILPIMWYHFNTISLTFIFSNLFAGPILGISIVLGLAIIIISFISVKVAYIPGVLLNVLLSSLIKIAEFFGNMYFSKIIVITPSLLIIICYYVICAIAVFMKKKTKFKIISVIVIFVVLGNFISIILANRDFKIYFVDVGQGDCTLIKTPLGKAILIDGGGATVSNSFDVGNKTLLPYLLDRKISGLDYIMVSHFDSDHCQGLEAVIENLKVKNLIISKQATITQEYKKIINMCKQKKVNIIVVKREDGINIDKYVHLEILHPSEKFLDDGKGGLNANAIVCKLFYKLRDNRYFTILFTGDIEEEAEIELEKLYGKVLKADILKVAHHGSKTSSREEFLKLVSPKIALIGVGENNKFGHPNDGVLERLKEIGSKVYRTDEDGEISIKIDTKGRYKVQKFIEK